MNTLKTIMLMGVLTAIIVSLGYFIGGRNGLTIAFIFAIATNFGSYWFSAPMALAMNNAQPVSRDQIPQLYEIVERLAARAKMKVPDIYVIPTDAANAFATGRDVNHAAVAVTEGIMRQLNWDELEGVLAHELSHVRNGDILITSIAACLASVITMIAHWGMYFGSGSNDRERGVNPIFGLILMIVAPIAAMFIQLAISRSREFEADASGARLCGKPNELADALQDIEQSAQTRPMQTNPAYSSLYIVLPNPGGMFANLMSTHPPTAERIRRLREMAQHPMQ
jgi:heat shock protein HtpX